MTSKGTFVMCAKASSMPQQFFDRVPHKTKRWNLSLRLTHSDGEQAAFDAPYRRTDLKKKAKGTGR